jgi:L-ascorbate metabolism protein UlaG (beta-lactamase superfamily)
MPFSFGLNLINRQSLLTDLALMPFIVLGGFLGILLVHRIPQKAFNNLIMALAALAAIFLCLKPFIMPNNQTACPSTQQKETKNMSITIQWLGHASFKITNSATIYIDPWKLPAAAHNATIVLISHSHFDHFSLPDIAEVSSDSTRIIGPADVIAQTQAGQTLTPGQSITIDSTTITATAAYNPDKQFHPRSNNWLGFIIEIDGKRIYYSGDTDLIEEMKSITNIDLALLPVGGTYTLDPAQAARAADLIKPKHAIPYHFGDIVGTTRDAEKFTQLTKCPATILKPGQSFSL